MNWLPSKTVKCLSSFNAPDQSYISCRYQSEMNFVFFWVCLTFLLWNCGFFFPNMCASMQIERQFIKINQFNGHHLITVIAISQNITFVPKHRSLTQDIVLKKLTPIWKPFYIIVSSYEWCQSKVKITSLNEHNDSLCKTKDNSLFCAVGMERNLTRRWFYAT